MSDLDKNESDPGVLWAEITRLQAAVKGPDGFDTWQAAATDERIKRVKAERDLAHAQSWQESVLKEVGEPQVIWVMGTSGVLAQQEENAHHYKARALHLAAKLFIGRQVLVDAEGFISNFDKKYGAGRSVLEVFDEVTKSQPQPTSGEQCQHDLCEPDPTLKLIEGQCDYTVIECTACHQRWTNPVKAVDESAEKLGGSDNG